MKKVLILSYFFPPCNLTAAQRPASWAKHLHLHGLYPHIITRKWERPLVQYADEGFATTPGEEIEETETYTVHRMPYRSSWRDLLWVRYGNTRFVWLRKLLTAILLLTQNISLRFSPFRSFYKKADELLREGDFEAIVISGNPYGQFLVGYLLHKKYGIPWIADYRDAWTTSEITGMSGSNVLLFFKWYDSFFEKKWIRTTSHITSVSRPLAEGIASLAGRPYTAVENGYREGMFDELKNTNKNKVFTVAYIGTLYDGQKIELFLSAFEKWIKRSSLSPQDCRVDFIGLAMGVEQERRVRSFSSFLSDYIRISGRIAQPEVLHAEVSSHVLLYVGWKGYKGIVPSKIYEYCASGTPVLVAPADGGEVDRIVAEARAGVSAETEEQIILFLNEQYAVYKGERAVLPPDNESAINRFSRKNQVGVLARVIHEVLS